MSVLALCGIGVLFGVSYYFLGALGAKSAGAYLALGATFLLALGSEVLFPMIEELFALPLTEEAASVTLVVTKALSIGYLVGMSADLCEQLGAPSLSRSLVFCGRMLIFSLALPYLKELISIAEEWLMQ